MSWLKTEIKAIALKACGMTWAVKYNTALARKELLSKGFLIIFLLNVITSCFSLTETSIFEILTGLKARKKLVVELELELLLLTWKMQRHRFHFLHHFFAESRLVFICALNEGKNSFF